MKESRRQLAAAVAALALSAACAHAPPAAQAPAAEIVWPAPPDAARVRLVGVVPDPAAPKPRRSFWRALLELVTGADHEAERRQALERPFGVAAADGGVLYVADPDAPAVLRVTGRAAPERIECRSRTWGAPMAVAVGAGGELFVADGARAEIVAIAPGGACRALGAGALERPTGIAASGDRLYVVDPPRHEVVVLSNAGDVVARWGTRGEREGELNFPTGIARAEDGTLLVVDALNFRVVRYSPEGEWLRAFGEMGDAGGAFARPKAVAADAAGHVYVSDAQRDAVLVFGTDGTFEYALGASGSEPGFLALPAGVAASGGRLYVADSHNHRIQVFEILGGS